MEHNLDNFYQNKWIRSCFGDSYYSNDSQLSFHGTSYNENFIHLYPQFRSQNEVGVYGHIRR